MANDSADLYRTVYRIEHEETQDGPYNHKFRDGGGLREIQARSYHARHPSPFNDGIEDFPEMWVFGFGSLAALYSWAAGATLTLAGAKLIVRRYCVHRDDVIDGHRQLVFRPPNDFRGQRTVFSFMDDDRVVSRTTKLDVIPWTDVIASVPLLAEAPPF